MTPRAVPLLSEARKNLFPLIEQVNDDRSPRHGRGSTRSTISCDEARVQSADRAMVKRINRLLDDVLRDPFTGIGTPERLKHAFAGSWSRRIGDEHRLVYVVEGDEVIVYQARFHYE